MAVTTEDDGFREIQLNGKQLVFLFMAVTVVSVVIFLIGVLVGRGVRAERAEAVQAEVQSDAPVAPAQRTPAATTDEADPRNAQPPSPAGDVEADTKSAARPAAEEPPVAIKRTPVDPPAVTAKPADAPAKVAPPMAHITPAPAAPAPAAAAISPPAAPAVAPPTAAAATEPATSADPSGDSRVVGYAVQVAAVNARGEADTIAKRLSAKGYSAYVEDPKGSVTMYRVRVGTFKTRREAQTTADRLKKEEKYKPWVTR